MREENAVKGHLHPISSAILEIYSIFSELGFEPASGPEVETEWYNFDALNIPSDHPSRDMQDTFWLRQNARIKHGLTAVPAPMEKNLESGQRQVSAKSALLLRTHTSPVQIRYMEEKLKAGVRPPYRVVVPGKVFRNEATDATHEAQFYQLEGLYVDKKVSLAVLKGTILHFFRRFFGPQTEIRLRPSYFPFVEPGVEVDVRFGEKWLEMMGAGLVHPNVFKAVRIEGHTGFAFGCGIDRLLMVRHGIPDIRLFYSGDLRFVNQF